MSPQTITEQMRRDPNTAPITGTATRRSVMPKAAVISIISASAGNQDAGHQDQSRLSEHRAGRDAKLSEAFTRMESEIFDLLNMARITNDVVEEAIGNPDEQFRLVGKKDCFYIPPSQVEMVLFAVANILGRTTALHEKWSKDFDAAGSALKSEGVR